MDRKKLHNFGLNTASVWEGRLIYAEVVARGEAVDVMNEKSPEVVNDEALKPFLKKLGSDDHWKKYLEGKIFTPETVNSPTNPYLSHLKSSHGLKYSLNYQRIEPTKFGLRLVVQETTVDAATAAAQALEKWDGNSRAADGGDGWSIFSNTSRMRPQANENGTSIEWSNDDKMSAAEQIPLIGYLVGRSRHVDRAVEAAKPANHLVPYDLTGFEYAALVWPQIDPEIKKIFDKAKIPNNVRARVLGHVGVVPEFDQLVLATAATLKAPDENEKIRKDAIAALKAFAVKENIGSDSAWLDATLDHGQGTLKAHAATGTALEELKKYGHVVGYKDDIAKKTPLDKKLMDSKSVTFDDLRARVQQGQLSINPTWDLTKKQGLMEMAFYWEKLGIPIKEAGPAAILNQLAKASDTKYLQGLEGAHPGVTVWFQRPDEYRSQITGVPGGDEFMKAWDYQKLVRSTIETEGLRKEASTKKIGELDSSPIAEKIGDGVKKNVKEFTSAIRRGDYATAAVYIAGAIALMHVLKIHKGGGDFVKKWGSYAVLAYAGVKVLEKAGIDVLKHGGVKGEFEELVGTNMEKALYIPGVPELRDVDPKVYIVASKFKVSDLYRHYKETPKDADAGMRWIDPRGFDYYREKFPAMSGDSTAARKANKEYDRIGRELYKLTKGIYNAYDRVMFSNPDAKHYHRKTFEDVFLRDSVLQNARVEEFMGSIIKYAQGIDATYKVVGAVSDKMSLFLEGKNMAPRINMSLGVNGNRVSAGTIMDIPVVVVASGGEDEEFVVFARDEYEKNPGSGKIATIKGKAGADNLKSELAKKMETLSAGVTFPLDDKGGRKKPEWNGANWVVDHEASDGAKYSTFGVNLGKDRQVVVQVSNDGLVTTENLMDPDKALIQAMLDKSKQSHLSALRPFMQAGKIAITSYTAGHEDFEITVAGEKVTVNYDITNKQFTLDDPAGLLASPKFQTEYAKLMVEKGNPELNETIAELLQKIEGAPQGVFMNALRSIAGQTEGKVLDGTVAEKRTVAALNAVKYAMIQKLKHAARQVDTIDALSRAQTDALGEMNGALKGVIAAMESYQSTNKPWTAEAYATNVLSPIRGSLPGSQAYKDTFAEVERKSYAQGGRIETTDLNQEFHDKVEARMKRFSEYAMDGGSYTFKVIQGSTEVELTGAVDLDNITTKTPLYARNTATAVVGQGVLAEEWKDPNMRAWYMLRYNDYVLNKVMSDSPQIDGFDVWAAENGISTGEIANMEPYDHTNADTEHAADRLTKLDEAVKKAFEAAVYDLERDIPGFKASNAKDFLNATGTTILDTGLLAVYKDSMSDNKVSELYTMSKDVSSKRSRKAQQVAIQKLVDERLLRDEIFSNTSKYFAEPVSWTTEFKMKHPSIINWPVIGHLLR